MDNRIFNVNGSGRDMLLATLKLVFQQSGFDCSAWIKDLDKGLVLLWHESEGSNCFPSNLTAEECLPFVEAWMRDPQTQIKTSGWDASVDHDGDNGKGWRIYCEDWGHVGDYNTAICAIKPVTLWYGK